MYPEYTLLQLTFNALQPLFVLNLLCNALAVHKLVKPYILHFNCMHDTALYFHQPTPYFLISTSDLRRKLNFLYMDDLFLYMEVERIFTHSHITRCTAWYDKPRQEIYRPGTVISDASNLLPFVQGFRKSYKKSKSNDHDRK